MIDRALKLCGIFLLLTSTASGQVRYDPARGVYLLPVHNGAGQLTEVVVEPTNRVQTDLWSSVRALSAGAFEYGFSIKVLPESPQGTSFLRVACPFEGRPFVMSETDHGDPPTGITSTHWLSPRGWECQIGISLVPGEEGVASIRSSLAPGFGSLIVRGSIQGVTWPTNDPTDETDSLSTVADSLQGDTPGGVVRRVPAILPTYFPSVLTDRLAIPYILQDNVRRMCAVAGWVRNQGLCNSLTVKLNAAAEAATRTNWSAWTGTMRAFVAEVEAQDGKGLSDGAADLLRTLAAGALAATH